MTIRSSIKAGLFWVSAWHPYGDILKGSAVVDFAVILLKNRISFGIEWVK